MTREDWRRSWKPWLRGTAFGFPIGALPAGGAEIPTFLSYSTERRLARKPGNSGTVQSKGVAGPRLRTMLPPPALWSRSSRLGSRPPPPQP
jgi:putative tricarboxylic transport membrane protein